MKAFKRIASLALAAILGLSALPVRAESLAPVINWYKTKEG